MSEAKTTSTPPLRASSANGVTVRRLTEGVARRWRRLGVAIASRMGRYNRWKQVDWDRIERLVFVCTGNICRSPYAEAIALIQGIDAVSCGTAASGGAAADSTAIDVATRFNVELRGHSSNRLVDIGILDSDLIVVMDVVHLASTEVVARRTGAQLTLLGLWDRQHPAVIGDPFGGPTDEYERCFLRIESCMDQLLNSMRNSQSNRATKT